MIFKKIKKNYWLNRGMCWF